MHRRLKKQESRENLSENAEYDAAKDEQRDIEARIEQIEKILKNAEVVVEEEVDLDKINIGCQVKSLIWNSMRNWNIKLLVLQRQTA